MRVNLGGVSQLKEYGGYYTGDPAHDTREFKKKLPLMVRAALEKVFYDWFKTHANEHFNRNAFNRYPDEYKYNSKANLEAWSRKNKGRVSRGLDTEMPLVKTGALRRNFLGGNFTFSRVNDELRVKWHGLPAYAYAYIKKGRQMNKAKALTDVNNEEISEFQKLFDKYLQEEINKFDKTGQSTGKTYGRVML